MGIREVRWVIPFVEHPSDSVVLFSACDDAYVDYAVSLARSIDLFSPGFSFVLHLINPDDNSLGKVYLLKQKLHYTRLAVSAEQTDLSGLKHVENRKAYFASARFPQLVNLLDHSKIPVLSLDADTLIVNPIDLNFSDKVDAEVVLLRRDQTKDQPEHLKIGVGSIWLKPTTEVRAFLSQVAEEIDQRVKDGQLEWFVDQIVFFRIMQIHQPAVKFYNLKHKYVDWDFNEKSIVWAGKGLRKEYDLRFFLLRDLLLLSERPRNLANQLWASLKASASQLSFNQWYVSRINVANRAMQRIALFIPRLDLPWKKGNVSVPPPAISEDVLDLRLHWKAFAIRLANAIERCGVPIEIVEIPNWEITRQSVEAAGVSLAIVPHRCFLDFEEGETPVMFYMQEFFRWIFVVNERGWSAASSCYPIDLTGLPENLPDSFGTYRKGILTGKIESKFSQKDRKSLQQLIQEKSIPAYLGKWGRYKLRPFIFFPLQIPHDQSVQYFSQYSEQEVVEAIVKWARRKDVALVLKPHPVNFKSTAHFESLVDNRNIFWSTAHVHDLIANSTGVYTINSGVGFEALLHIRPVITFGKVEYDCVAFQTTPEMLDEAWDYCLTVNNEELKRRYSRFINWFLNEYALDMSQSDRVEPRLQILAEEILNHAKVVSGTRKG